MGQPYTLKKLLRQVGPELLRTYFNQRKLLKRFDWSLLAGDPVEPLHRAIGDLSVDHRQAVETEFIRVTELADDAGSVLIRGEVDAHGMLWGQRLCEMKNGYERAFLVLVEAPELLRTLVEFRDMDRFAAARWTRRTVGRGLRPRRDAETLKALANAVSLVFQRQGRGRECHVDVHERQSPRRVCYFAYQEDFPQTTLGFDHKGNFGPQTVRTAIETIFVYYPDDGWLESVAPGSSALKDELAAAFCSRALGLDEAPPPSGRPPFDLALLKRRGFAFDTDPEDNIERVEVRQLRLDLPGASRPQIMVSTAAREYGGQSVHDVIDSVLNQARMPLSAMDVSKVKLCMKFRAGAGRRAKTVTFDITAPDRCNLKDTGVDAVARRYLRRWGLASA